MENSPEVSHQQRTQSTGQREVQQTSAARRNLKELFTAANDLHPKAQACASECVTKAKDALQYAIQCGAALNEAKSLVPHGDWLDTLAAHCPDITDRTAQRYMRLSNTTLVSHGLPDNTTLTQAYKLLGITSQPVERPEPDSYKPMQSAIIAIEDLFGLRFRRWDEDVFTAQLPQADQHTLRSWAERLKRPHDMYVEVVRRLGNG